VCDASNLNRVLMAALLTTSRSLVSGTGLPLIAFSKGSRVYKAFDYEKNLFIFLLF